jgi:hypothetical protein
MIADQIVIGGDLVGILIVILLILLIVALARRIF